MISEKIKNLSNDPLYRNSFYLISSRILTAGSGFFFWIVAARLYSVEDVGVATVLISSLGLVILLSRFGFDMSLIRFIRIYDKEKVFSTALMMTTAVSIAIGFIYIYGVSYFSPDVAFIQKPIYAFIFLISVITMSIFVITGVAFKAIRKSNFFLIQNILNVVRIPLLILFVYLGSFGIFGSVGLASFLSALFGGLFLRKFIKFNHKVNKQFLKASFNFSSGNYISNILNEIPIFILPIIILNILGKNEAAIYYIAFAIGQVIFMIPDALSISLLIEGSHGENLRKNVVKSGVIIFATLIPITIFVYLFGDHVLNLFGENYLEAFDLLRVLAISSLFYSAYVLFIPIQNVRMNVKSIVALNSLRFIILLGLTYFFIPEYGIVGVGYAWLITYMLLTTITIGVAKKEEWI